MFVPDVFALMGVSARCFGIIISLPMSDGIQTLPRLFIAIAFGCALSPLLPVPSQFSMFGLIPEFLLGVLIGAPLLLAAEAAHMFGELLDTARGQTIGSVVDPLNGQQNSDMASIARLGVVALALHMGALELMMETLKRSYILFPLGGELLAEDLLLDTVRRGFALIGVAIGFSTIWLVAYLMIDLVCAMFSKMVQGMYFTSTAGVAKLVITMFLLTNLLAEPHELREIIDHYVFGSISIWGDPPATITVSGP